MAKQGRISVGAPPATHQLKVGRVPSDARLITFSFRYFKQKRYFGLDGISGDWFVDLLARLTDLNKLKVDTFIKSGAALRGYRYHEINWTQKNIPIQRADLELPAVYGSDEEYPVYQFQISTARGRVVGFWDENWVFNIILLDPSHNIQPSKDFGYKVTDCSSHPCRDEVLAMRLERADQFVTDANIDNVIRAKIRSLLTADPPFVVFYLDHDHHNDLDLILASDVPYSPSRVLSEGIKVIKDAL